MGSKAFTSVGSGQTPETSDNAVAETNRLAEIKRKAAAELGQSLSEADAIDQVFREQPELYRAYRKQTAARE
mgnify:CR=1 FL=1